MMMRGNPLLFWWLLKSVCLDAWGRWLVALSMVAIGVMLAVSIHTVNHSALAFFGEALDTLNGQASAQLVAPMGEMDDRQVQRWDEERTKLGIQAVSPVLVVQTDRLTVLGLDIFKAASVSPSLMPFATLERGDLFDPKALFLSNAALEQLHVHVGEELTLRLGGVSVQLVVKGEVPGVGSQALGVMDIGSAQWAFNRVGWVSRLDIRLLPWQTPQGLRERLKAQNESIQLVTLEDRDRRMSLLSKAYRVNLSVLAMVAFLTGGFLVSTAVNLSVVRQRSALGLLGVLGASEAWLKRFVWAQGALIGLLGGVMGAGLGLLLAYLLMQWFGGDLGGRYFSSHETPMVIDGFTVGALVFASFLMGLAASWWPLLQINWRRPMGVLKGDQAETVSLAQPSLQWSLITLTISFLLLLLPSIDELPWAAYGSIAALIAAGLLALPWGTAKCWGLASRFLAHRSSHAQATGSSPEPVHVHVNMPAVLRLAIWRLSQAPAESSPLIKGTVAAFSLTVAMMVMVSSFRESVADWLLVVLPADLYTMTSTTSDQPGFDPSVQSLVASVPQVLRVQSTRIRTVRMAFDRPEVTLMAKPVDFQHPEQSVALIGSVVMPEGGTEGRVIVFGSEAMADLYGWRAGQEASLPLTPQGAQKVWVAGLFRDYGRQHGSVVISVADYERLTLDRSRTNLSVWLDKDADPAQVISEIQAKLPHLELKWSSARDLRQLSLTIFDRSFAMTYALEAVALLVAMFSVASGVTGQLILRRREFGVLAQLGLSESQCLTLVSLEVGLMLTLATVWASLLGLAISQILIQKVNPQSFHWTMSTHFAVGQWVVICTLLLMIGALTARFAARQGLDFKRLAQSLKADW